MEYYEMKYGFDMIINEMIEEIDFIIEFNNWNYGSEKVSKELFTVPIIAVA